MTEKKFYTQWWFFVIIGVVILGIIGALLPSSDNPSSNSPSVSNGNSESSGTADSSSVKSWNTLTSFSGSSDKNTDTFNIQGSKFKLKYSVDIANEYAILTLSVYEEGAEFPTETMLTDLGFSGSQETIIYEGPGTYYLDIGAANLNSWSVSVEDYY